MLNIYNPGNAIWSSYASSHPVYPPLTGDTTTDVLIIGAGITGLSLAYNLRKNGFDVIVVDASETGMGTTGFSTGNLYVPNAKFHKILSKHDQKGLRSVKDSRAAALRFIEDRIEEFSIECDFMKVPWYYFTNRKRDEKEIEKEREAIFSSGLQVTDTAMTDFPFEYSALALVGEQAQINPLEYVRKLAEAVSDDHCRIFENTRVTSVRDYDPCYAETANGVIKAKKVVQATHTPNGVYAVHAMMEVYREYAVAARIDEDMPAGIYWALEGDEKYSIRTYDTDEGRYIIVLGETGKTGQSTNTLNKYQKLENYTRTLFNVEEILYHWAAQNYSPSDYLPFIGKSPMQDNIYIATGFAADGLVFGTLAAMIISDMIAGKADRYTNVYHPGRMTSIASTKTIKENIEVTAGLVKDYVFGGNEEELAGIGRGEGRVVEFNKEKAAAFRDQDDHLHVVSAKCTHLGCIVQWNEAEKSWDCPCHGSRFTVDGDVIEGPAFRTLEKYWRKEE